MEIGNLNPRYTLLSYDINLMKNTIKSIDPEELLSQIPHTKIPKDTLFYHFDEDVNYYFNFLKNTDASICQVSWNNEALNLLDLSFISIEFGFNPTMFYYKNPNTQNDRLKNITNYIIDYCISNQLDGYITYDVKNSSGDYDSDACVTYVKSNGSPLCPTVHLIQPELKLLSTINLKKSNKTMTKSELTRLHNVVFCTLLNIMSIVLNQEVDIQLESSFLYKTLHFDTEENYSLNEFMKLVKPHLLSLLDINSSNLSDECQFDYYQDYLMMNPPVPIDNLKADIISNVLIKSSYSDSLFSKALALIASQFNLPSFVYVNFHQLEQLPILKQYSLEVMKDKTIDEMRTIMSEIEKTIMNHLYINYKNTAKGHRANINFVNLEYLKKTYEYMKSVIMNRLMNLGDKAFSIINGEIDKEIIQYFNVDYLYHDIVATQYKKPQTLHQDLLTDVTKYKQSSAKGGSPIPSINLKYLKIIASLSDNEQGLALNQFLTNIELEIYNFYKAFISGHQLFVNLYQFLGVESIYDYLKNFAINNQLNISIVIGYNDFSLMDQMENFNVISLHDEMKEQHESDIEFYKSKLDLMKTKLLIVKFLKILSQFLELSIDDTDARKYLIDNIEQIIHNNADIENVLSNINADWYNISKNYNDAENQQLFELFLQNNKNEDLLSYIYKYLDIDLLPETKTEIVKLIKHKQLLKIWISFLNKEITKDILSNIVFVSYSEISNQQLITREKERSRRDEEHSEEMSAKSRSKRTQRQEPESQEAQEARDREERREKESQERKERETEQKSLEKKERETAEQKSLERTERETAEQKSLERKERETAEQKRLEREERREQRRLEKEQKEIEAEERRQAREIKKIAKQEKLEAKRIEDEETESM